MRAAHQIEPITTNRLLTCLGLAIDEAKLVRSIIESKDLAYKQKTEKSLPDRLAHIDREIIYLEAKLAEVREKANQGLQSQKSADNYKRDAVALSPDDDLLPVPDVR